MLEKIFKAYDIRGVYGEDLDEERGRAIGRAAGAYLGEDGPGRIVVGRDMRASSPSLAAALIEGIRDAGMDVLDLGRVDTPLVYFAINHLETRGGIQVTASHNPPAYNGFKISGPHARPVGEATGLASIRALAAEGGGASATGRGAYEELDLWDAYRSHIHRFFAAEGAAPLKVVIDASNGMAGELIPRVFEGASGLEIVPLNLEMTGSFAHEPNPLVHENMIPTEEAVRAHGADLGVCFDGDADRCMLVDDAGRTVGCDHLTALYARHFLPHEAGGTIVYDLRSSRILRETVEALGGRPERCRVGHVFMKGKMKECDAVLGGELSGHFYFRDNFYADSGALAFATAIAVLREQRKPLGELIEPLRAYPQSGERNFEVGDKAAVMEGIKSAYGETAAIDELDGVTVDAWESAGWWFNVRPSNTEPLLRFNAEARDEATLERLIADVGPVLGSPQQ